MKRTGIVICNYNKCQDVLNCIQSVLEMQYTDYDIYVVDNGSSDDSVEQIEKKFGDKVSLVKNKENLGGSGGFNSGIRKALEKEYEYIYCLDNDVLCDENALGELVKFLDNNSDCGMAGSVVYNMEQPDTIQQFGQIVDFDEFCTEAKHIGKRFDEDLPEVEYSDAVAACSLLVRKSLIDEIGLMPEENFLYWDDTEWGFRCNIQGLKVASVRSSVVLHRMGAKKENVNTFPTYYAWRNWIRFFIKFTKEENIEKMCRVFLDSVFEVQYEGFYRQEYNKAKTVMLAYDDAIHGITGKAGENRIFDIDYKDIDLKKLLEGKKSVCILKGRCEDFSYDIAEKIININSKINVTCDPKDEHDLELVMCESVFLVNDMKFEKVYIDRDMNVFYNEEHAMKIINYPYSKEIFRFANLPVFIENVKKIRKNMKQK